MLVTIQNAHPVGGTITAPPSKSMAHRAVLCAALAEGRSHITNLEFSKDISATLSAAAQLCAAVDTGVDDATVQGLGHFLPLTAPVDCCESGSTLRFLIPIASLTGQAVTFTGRGRLMERPQSVYEALYREQGLRFEQSAAGLTVEGALTPGDYRLAGNVSSQFISGLLFALPLLLLYVVLFSAGVGMALSALSVFFRDVCHLWGVVITAWTYATPLFYPVEILPDWAAPLMQYNPMFHYVSYFRDLILSGTVPGLQENLLCLGMAVAAFAIGLLIFKKTEKKFILYV